MSTETSHVRNVSHDLVGRALWSFLEGDRTAAFRDAERALALADRTFVDGQAALISVIAVMMWVDQAWNMIDVFSEEGLPDPEVVSRLLARPTLVARGFDPLASAMILAFRENEILLPLLDSGELDFASLYLGGFERSWWSPGIKMNRTLRLLAEDHRRVERRWRLDPVAREPALGLPSEERVRNRVLLSWNLGEGYVASIRRTFAVLVQRWDRLHVREDLSRWRLALLRHERRHGRLPETLAAVVSDATELDAVPIDPFSGAPYRYDPARRVLWSVGEDGVDDGASDLDAYRTELDREFWDFDDWMTTLPAPREER